MPVGLGRTKKQISRCVIPCVVSDNDNGVNVLNEVSNLDLNDSTVCTLMTTLKWLSERVFLQRNQPSFCQPVDVGCFFNRNTFL